MFRRKRTALEKWEAFLTEQGVKYQNIYRNVDDSTYLVLHGSNWHDDQLAVEFDDKGRLLFVRGY